MELHRDSGQIQQIQREIQREMQATQFTAYAPTVCQLWPLSVSRFPSRGSLFHWRDGNCRSGHFTLFAWPRWAHTALYAVGTQVTVDA